MRIFLLVAVTIFPSFAMTQSWKSSPRLARILKYFGSGHTQVYVGSGLGVTRVTSTREAPTGCALVNNVFTCTGRDSFRSASTAGTLSGFAGVRIPAGNVMFVRPEFGLSKAGDHMRIGGTLAVGASW